MAALPQAKIEGKNFFSHSNDSEWTFEEEMAFTTL